MDPFSLNGLNRENVTLKSSGKQAQGGMGGRKTSQDSTSDGVKVKVNVFGVRVRVEGVEMS